MSKQLQKTVLILYDQLFPEIIKSKLQNHCQILIRKTNEPISETLEKARQSNVIISDALTWQHLTKASHSQSILETAKNLELFATSSVGYDHLNLEYLKSNNVRVTNAPGVSEYAVAESAVCLAIAACKRMEEARRALVNGQWIRDFRWLLGQDIRGSTIGIVGLGNIGFLIGKTMRSMAVSRVLYHSRTRHQESEGPIQAEYVGFPELLHQSDIIFACVPLTPETNKMFNKETFNAMKNNAVFINISRGGIVNQEDLIEALRNNTIFAAGLDTVYPEPLPANHELTKLPNCVLMPHIASSTVNARKAMVDCAASNVLAFLEDRELLNPVEL